VSKFGFGIPHFRWVRMRKVQGAKKRMPQATQQFAHDDTLSIRKEADHHTGRTDIDDGPLR